MGQEEMGMSLAESWNPHMVSAVTLSIENDFTEI